MSFRNPEIISEAPIGLYNYWLTGDPGLLSELYVG